MNSDSPAKSPWLALAASVLVCCSVWHWAESVLIPANNSTAQSRGIPVGNNSDLYPRWLGARELLLHGRDPYSTAVTREIQKGFYGEILDPRNPAHPIDQAGFAYPLYVVFLLAPTVTLPFSTVSKIFGWLLLLGIAASVPLWAYAIGLRLRRAHLAAAMLLAISSYPAVMEFHMQNLAALVALLLAGAVAAVARGRLVLSGFLLALATVKPDIALPLVLWLLLWAANRERRRLIWAFAASMAALLAAAQAISPGWMGRFLAAVQRYRSYGTNPSILQLLLPSVIVKFAMAVLAVYLLVLYRRWRTTGVDSDGFAWMLAAVTATTLVTIPKLSAYNQVLLIPPLLVLLAKWGDIQAMGRMSRAMAKAAFTVQGWQWTAAVAVSLCSLLIPAERMRAMAQVPVYTLLALPALTFLAVAFATLSRPRN